MPYESNRDKEIFSKDAQSETGKIVVSVHSYNNGPKKLQITREVKNRDGEFIFAKLGRLSKDEIEGILPLVKEALEVM
jgi:hypothetical protein